MRRWLRWRRRAAGEAHSGDLKSRQLDGVAEGLPPGVKHWQTYPVFRAVQASLDPVRSASEVESVIVGHELARHPERGWVRAPARLGVGLGQHLARGVEDVDEHGVVRICRREGLPDELERGGGARCELIAVQSDLVIEVAFYFGGR